MTHDSTTAWGELLATLGELDQSFLEGSRAVSDDRHVADGYRMIATTLGVALDTWLFAEPTPAAVRGAQHAVPTRPALGW